MNQAADRAPVERDDPASAIARGHCLIVPKVTPRSRCFRTSTVNSTIGSHEDHHPSRDLRPGHAIDVSLQAGEVHRHGLGFVVVERHREAELVPGRDETEDRRHRHPGRRLRDDDTHEGGEARVAVDQRRLFERARDLVDEALHQPDRERQVEARVKEDQADVRVLERQATIHDEHRNDDGEGRQEPRREDEEQPVLRPRDPEAGEPVGAERSQADRRQRGQAADDEAVAEVVIKVAGVPATGLERLRYASRLAANLTESSDRASAESLQGTNLARVVIVSS